MSSPCLLTLSFTLLYFLLPQGDISYADNRAGINNGSIYEGVLNDFYNEVQPSSAYGAYMTSSGNHESIIDFLAYQKRNSPSLPLNGSPFWHSYNYGPIHFLAFDQDQNWQINSPQYNFIVADLKAVDRTVTPWVIAYNHFPLLCSNNFWCPDAVKFQDLYEPIFNAKETKVDLTYGGHVHAAEILFPQQKMVVVQDDFVNVPVTMQVMCGFPGDIEVCCNDWYKPKPAWSYWREDDVFSDGGMFGFSEFMIQNNTHARLRMFDSNNETIVTELWWSRAV
jgi:acid phosphatase type 7